MRLYEERGFRKGICRLSSLAVQCDALPLGLTRVCEIADGHVMYGGEPRDVASHMLQVPDGFGDQH